MKIIIFVTLIIYWKRSCDWGAICTCVALTLSLRFAQELQPCQIDPYRSEWWIRCKHPELYHDRYLCKSFRSLWTLLSLFLRQNFWVSWASRAFSIHMRLDSYDTKARTWEQSCRILDWRVTPCILDSLRMHGHNGAL